MTTRLRHRGESGATTVELVLVLPVFMAVVLLAVQAGMVLFAAQVVEDAAHNAVEAARGESDPDAAGVTAARRALAATGAVTDAAVDVRRDGDRVIVDVTGAAPRVVPGVALRVGSIASGVVERFRPQPERP
jgi:Flp pilus assembly protein TadG